MSVFSNLSTLESAGLIQVAKVEPDLEYLFRHSLVQDAAYASLLEEDRKRLHAAVGEAIEQLYPERKRELAAILGHHFKQAGQDERALGYFILAGDVALSIYANQEAEAYYRRAMELECCSGPQIAWLYSGLGEALYRQSRFDEAVKAIQTGIDIYKSLGDSDGTARLYARAARVKWFAHERPGGLRLCLEGMEVVKEAPSSVGKAALLHETGRAYFFNGHADQALPLCQEALAMAEQFNAVNVQADTLATLGLLPGISPQESLQALRKAVELSEKNKLYQIAMRANQNLGTMTRTWLADNQEALKYFHRAAELGKLRGAPSEEILGLLSFIFCLFSPGRFREIETEIPHLEELASKIADPAPTMVTIKYLKGILAGFKGDWDKSISIFRECLETWQSLEDLESETYTIDQLSWALLEKNRWGDLDDLSEVESLLQRAIQIVEKSEAFESLWVYPRMTILRARQGRMEEARQWLERSYQGMAKHPSAWDEMFQLECAVEIAIGERNWDLASDKSEKLAIIDKQVGFEMYWARSMLIWADIHMHKGEIASLEKAQNFLNQGLDKFRELGVVYYARIAEDMLRAIQSRLHDQAVGAQLMTRELKKARQVQESLLPENPPELPGWELAVSLEPAHETSGDFYDYLTLPEGRSGLVIADVTDKGTSAALYMALSRSILRTYASNHPSEPELTIAETNRRLLADTHGGLFITLFYGILNPLDGYLTYCSAGHHPAFLVRASDGTLEQLERTGIPLGVFDEADWEQVKVEIKPGDALVLYTDGITDAQNSQEEFYGLERFKDMIVRYHDQGARALHQALIADVHQWMANAPQFDDITLMVVVREK
ncbi:MAG: SpoIIE family protein phosphatase [Acidobacteriaceae bacterium]